MYRLLITIVLMIASVAAFAEKSRLVQGSLENGLRYAILPLHNEKGRLEIRMKVYAGAVDETDEQPGVAHMVEHLVFRATESHPKGIMQFLHNHKWVRGQNYNALTTYDSTTYMFTPPKTADLDTSLATLSQMLFHAKLTQKDLDDERKIIMEEWRQGQGIANTMNQQRSSAIRANSRYTRNPVIGTTESIANMPASQLQQYYSTWYAPNNMQLLIVGDTNPSEAKKILEKYFGKVSAKTLPKRDYLDPILENRLLVNKIQDPRSGVSQIAYIFRLDDSKTRIQNEQGRFERLVDRIALASLQQRLRNQSKVLPQGISNILPRKSDIGPSTTAIGLFATVEKTAHLQGLKQIFEEMERIKRFPITKEELAKQKMPIQAQIDNAKKNKEDRNFIQWMQRMMDTVLMDKEYLTQPEIAALTEPLLEKITATDVNNRINEWFSAEDRIVNYQPPRETQLILTKADIERVQSLVLTSQISAPEAIKDIIPMSLSALTDKGEIVAEREFSKQNVTHWQLSNNDKVIWLKSDIAGQKTYFEAQSSAGFNAQGLGAWQSQLASQLIAQNAPLDWEIEQLNRWKELNKVNLSIKQTATKLVFSGFVDNERFQDQLRLFYAYQLETKVKDGLDESKESIARAIDLQSEKNIESERLKALTKLRFNQENTDGLLPSKASLEKLTEDDLNTQWAKMMSAPTTYFILNNMGKEEVKKLVTDFLASFPRKEALKSTQSMPVEGKEIARFAMNLELKDDVKMWAFTPYVWQGKDAMLVSLLRNIATNKLKLKLRDQNLGVYSLRFESKLNPETQRIESELSFVANPVKTDNLIQQAREVFADLPNQITEEDIKAAKAQFLYAEKVRLKEPHTWLSRLILSENNFGNPQYLTDMQSLADEINLEKVRAMAGDIFNFENEKIFITTPKK